jgi:hypothetical protein
LEIQEEIGVQYLKGLQYLIEEELIEVLIDEDLIGDVVGVVVVVEVEIIEEDHIAGVEVQVHEGVAGEVQVAHHLNVDEVGQDHLHLHLLLPLQDQ